MISLRGIALMVRRSLRQHALSTIVTAISVGLAVGLLMSVFVIKDQTYRAFTASDAGFDGVLGARGSQLQLVLNSVYHLDQSTGNLNWSQYQQIKSHPSIKRVIPISVGDNYNGFRIVGTVPELFTEHEYSPGSRYKFTGGGRVFDPARREAVIGSFVAKQTGLKVGDKFNTFHGLSFDPGAAHNDEFLVVGILEPTNTPTDHVLWIPLEGYWRMSGHSLKGTGEEFVPKPGRFIADKHKEISAVLLVVGNPMLAKSLAYDVNAGSEATLAFPIGETIARLFDRVAWVHNVLALVAYLVVVVAAGSILASVYNSMNERRREFAILRALGASKSTVFSAIVVESGVIALLGSLVGFVVYGVLVGIAAWLIRAEVGIVVNLTEVHPVLIYTPLGMTALGAISGIVPAIKAYATDVAENLVPVS